MCIFNLAGLVLMRPPGVSAGLLYVTRGTVVAISFVVLWHFWNGRNWARWLVLATSVVSLLNLSLLRWVPGTEKALLVAEAALGIWLLFWLNTSTARAFFHRSRESGAA
jgi:hypothetical protein